MKGFIVKDLLIVKENLKASLIILGVYLLLFIGNPSNLSFLPPFMSFYLMLSTFSYDELNKWESYAFSFPSGRRNIVLSKYISTFILTLISYALIFVLSIGISLYLHNLNFGEMFITFLANMASIIFLLSIIYPIIFKFGIEKARLSIFYVVVGIVLLFTLVGNFISTDILSSIFNVFIYIMPFIVIGTLILSYLISIKIMSKKEL